MAWLANRRAEVKARKEAEAIANIKEKEVNRKKTVKAGQALEELKEQMQRVRTPTATKQSVACSTHPCRAARAFPAFAHLLLRRAMLALFLESR